MRPDSWQPFWLQRKEKSIDTLTAFVRDAEHEYIAVITALQAHIDLLRMEQISHLPPETRFAILDRAIARLIFDTAVLAAVAAHANAVNAKTRLNLMDLVQQVIDETAAALETYRVTLACHITRGTTVLGSPELVKLMLTILIGAVLQNCQPLETIRVIGKIHKRHLELSFDTGLAADDSAFTPWRLGDLRLLPTNGEGIGLAAVDAIARLQHSKLQVRNIHNEHPEYKLTFDT